MNVRERRIQHTILRWYRRHGRDLPWRRTRDPYAILVSEVMLQQTQVDRVKPKYRAWMRNFPTVGRLARVSLKNIMRVWSGLGYNRRAVYLRQAARAVATIHHGRFPTTVDELKKLPGVGPYTAGAVAAFAFGQRVDIIDTNVRRVISRLFFGLAGPSSPPQLRRQVIELVPRGQAAGEWHHALMDLGARICTSRRPACPRCPVRSWCRAYPRILKVPARPRSARHPFNQSDRFWRGRIVRLVTADGPYTERQLRRVLQADGQMPRPRLRYLLRGLTAHGLIWCHGQRIQLPV